MFLHECWMLKEFVNAYACLRDIRVSRTQKRRELQLVTQVTTDVPSLLVVKRVAVTLTSFLLGFRVVSTLCKYLWVTGLSDFHNVYVLPVCCLGPEPFAPGTIAPMVRLLTRGKDWDLPMLPSSRLLHCSWREWITLTWIVVQGSQQP